MKYKSIYKLFEASAKKYGDNYALYIRRLFRIEKYTYKELLELFLRFGAFLRKNGVKRGDRVMMWSYNMPEYVVAYLGSLIYGAVLVPVNVSSSKEVVGKYLKQTGAKIIFQSKFVDEKVVGLKTIFMEDVVDLIRNETKEAPVEIPIDALAEIVFTSGTTGTPKGVTISHKNILYQVEKLETVFPKYAEYRLLSILPLSHVLEQIVGLFCPLMVGGTIYYLPRLNPVTIGKALKKYKITHLGVVPQVLQLLIDRIEFQISNEGKTNKYELGLKLAGFLPITARRRLFAEIHKKIGGHLREVGCGGAPLDAKLGEKWERMGVKVIEGYGASETTGAVFTNNVDKRRFGKVGKILPGMDYKLGVDGEILIKGENVSGGYFGNKEETKLAFDNDGYFHTGDVGRVDGGGYLEIVGRSKFKIVTAAGDKIYPEDIEKTLNGDERVKQSCAFGFDDGGGEMVYVVVIPHQRTGFDLEKVIEETNSKLEEHQKIRLFSLWPTDEFPLTTTLKLDRKKIKEMVEGGRGNSKEAALTVTSDKLIKTLALVSRIKSEEIKENTRLVEDLKVDSLKRAAIAALIEEEFGVDILETEIKEGTTVAGVRKIIEKSKKIEVADGFPEWPLSGWATVVREFLRTKLLFPLQDQYITDLKIVGEENLKKIKNPSILIFNHVGQNDATIVIRVLPKWIRKKQAALADSNMYDARWKLFFQYLGANAYSINKRGGPVREGLDTAIDLLDQGWSLMIAPEGEIGQSEKLREFKLGTAMLAIESGVPIVPFKIEGYKILYPRTKKFPFLPDNKGPITVKVGEPIVFDKNMSYKEANRIMWEAMEKL